MRYWGLGGIAVLCCESFFQEYLHDSGIIRTFVPCKANSTVNEE